MKKISLILAVFFAASFQTNVMAVNDGLINFFPISAGDTISGPGSNHFPWHHAPARPVVLPVVEQAGTTLFFYPDVEGTLSFRIEDATRNTICSDNIYLYIDEQNEYSVASLPAGGYYLIIAVAGREYEGEFTIE